MVTMTAASSPRGRSAVRVGVRVRPLASQELSQEGGNEAVVTCHGSREVRLGDRRFTYDAVFNEQTEQLELYASVAPPLLEGVLEGYNATIMAYGQTGSGKTYTMGSEAHKDTALLDNTGLIPRFMTDLFDSLQRKQHASSAAANPNEEGRSVSLSKMSSMIDYKVEASFLEVYGEDVHDLLLPSRPSVPLREDAKGGVICSGLTQKIAKTASDALQVLHEGTLHRTTAATLMNLKSSRSHAVFTITLTQKTLGEDGMEIDSTSRFTFVDLAGSERMKKTGAEGERAREGIKINEGLLALGNVINALADDERSGKKPHVPYRQSKLTRLLQDALGGNSQTLFLACVSPSSVNASETLSTLRYANRARNIKNAPVQNVDGSVLELQRLRSWSSILQTELLKVKFYSNNMETDESCETNLLERDDVKEYLAGLAKDAETKNEGASSMIPLITISSKSSSQSFVRSMTETNQPITHISVENKAMPQVNLESLDEIHPDDDLKILDSLLEMQKRDQEFNETEQKGHQKIKEVDGELAKQEELLLKLRGNLEVYRDIKADYENAITQVKGLEDEKADLMVQLEKAAVDPSQGDIKSLQRKKDQLELALVNVRQEAQVHRKKCRDLEKESQKYYALERKIADLKHGKAEMIRRQKEAAVRHRDYTESKQREIATLKRKANKQNQKVTKLEAEVQTQQRNLEKRQKLIHKLNEKVKESQSHLKKLLVTRQKGMKRNAGGTRRLTMSKLPPARPQELVLATFAGSTDEVEAIISSLQQSVLARVVQADLEKKYEEAFSQHSAVMSSMVDTLRDLKGVEHDSPEMEQMQQAVLENELKGEILGSTLKKLKEQMTENEKRDSNDNDLKKLVEDRGAPVLRSVILELLELYATSELRSQQARESVAKKQNAVVSLEKEVDLLQEKLEHMTKDLVNAQAGIHSERISREIDSLKQMIAGMEANIDELKKENDLLRIESIEYKEKLSMYYTTSNSDDRTKRMAPLLDEIQSLLRKSGRSAEAEEVASENFFDSVIENTLLKKIEEVKGVQGRLQEDIAAAKIRINHFCQCLGEDPTIDDDDLSMQNQIKALEALESELKDRMEEGIRRRTEIQQGVESIFESLGLAVGHLPTELQVLLGASEDSSVTDVSDKFLSDCESALARLRIQKSDRVAQHIQKINELRTIVKDASITANQGIKIMNRCSKSIPSWWSAEVASKVAKAISTKVPSIDVSDEFSNHANFLAKELDKILSCRRDLSHELKCIVEHTQKSLLDTVDGESETVEAYASFHQALFRLPELSKERIETFQREIEALALCVDAMTQSEVEALTVVWEALSIPAAVKGEFWERVESMESEAKSGSDQFSNVYEKATTYGEDWIAKGAQTAKVNAALLNSRLAKLETIHKEVEKLRTRQDAKSNILSLDSEVRILNAQLQDFEDRKCSKSRLLSRNTGSSHLLKEERYRKQMKAKFTKKMEQLAVLLQAWVKEEGTKFDSELLSEDVRMLLKNSKHMGSWIDSRNEFMHLRTVKTDRKKRRHASSGSSQSDASVPGSQNRGKRSKISPVAPPSSARVERIRARTMALQQSRKSHKRTSETEPAPELLKRHKKASSVSPKPFSKTMTSSSPKESTKFRTTVSDQKSKKQHLQDFKESSRHNGEPSAGRFAKQTASSASKRVALSTTTQHEESSPKDPVFSLGTAPRKRRTAQRTTRSSSRNVLSPKTKGENVSEGQNETVTSKRITRAAAAAAKKEKINNAPTTKKLVLPPFAHVLEQAFSPSTKENDQM